MKITKRILSVTIAATLAAQLFNGVNIFAEGEYSFADIELIMEEEGLNGSVSEHAPLNPVFVDIEPEESNDRDFEARAEELDEADDADTAPDEPDRSIDPDVVWDALFSMEFGDSYNKPYHHNSNSIAVTGDSNRLVIEETDLHLTGKNDLDFSLKRQYSNQDDNEMYFPSSSTTNIVTNFKLYSYRNTSTNEDINIAFLTEDQMYQFMPDEFCVSQLRANDRKSYRLSNGSYIYYYNFYNVYRFNADSGIVLQRNTGIAPVSIQIQDIGYGLTDYPMFSSSNNLYGGWRFVMPAASFHVCDWDYTNSSHTSISRDFIGAFRDIHGNVSMINAHDTVHFSNLSSSHMNVAQNNRGKSIQYTAFYNGTSTFANTGIKYNLTAQDQDGLTYYFYCDAFEQAISNHSAGTRFYMSVIAVEDNYGNYIRYLYGDEAKAGAITGIIDTYGREISISRTTNSCTVSYDDENSDTKTITYSSSTLPASTLNNNSLLSHRDIGVFTVTNQLGETTEYYSRPAELITYYESSASSKFYNVITGYEGAYISHQNNIELIEYPTGAKTEYEYTSLGIVDKSTKSMQQEYAVSASRDITDNSTENDTDYSFGNNTSGITKTAINNSSDAKTVSIHNEYRQLTSEKTTPSASLYPYYSVSYIYDTCGYPKNITTNNNGSSRTVYRTNYADGRVHTEYDGTYKTAYEYYGNNVIKTAITYKKSGSNYVEQFRYTTTPNAVGDKPEYARILKSTNGQVMSQVKYEYNTDGEISAIKQWTNDTNADGLLDETDDIIILNHSYQTGADNYLTYSEYINNVLNVDDTNEGTVSSTYKLNMFGNPVSKTDPYSAVSHIDYDDLNRPVKYTYANNAEATVVYSLSNLYTLVTTPDGIKKKNIYDKLGRLVKVQRIYGNVTNTLEEYSYDSAGRVSKKINRTDSNVGTMEQYTYNALNKLVEKKVYSLPNTLLYTEAYSYSDNDITITTTAADNTAAAQRTEIYNNRDLLTQKQTISGNTTLNEYYTYDYLDRMITSTDANNNLTSYEYDCKSNMTKVTDAAGNETNTEYDLANRVYSVTDANGNISYTEYDKLGRTIRETKPFNNTSEAETKTYYDKNSNVVKTAVKKSNNVYTEEEYRYDVMGNLTGVIANDGTTDIVTQYEYDSANRMTRRITGLSSYSANPNGGSVTTYTYGVEGFLECETNPLGIELWNFEYDYLGNVKEALEENAYRVYSYGPFGLTSDYRHLYSLCGTKKEYTYNSLGMITQTKNTDSKQGQTPVVTTESYTYDAFGRPATHTANDGSVQSYTYDNNSNVTGYTLNKNSTTKNQISYAYNNLNQLTSLSKDGIITSYEYDSVGHLTSKENNCGISTEYTYNAAGLVTGLVNKVNNTSVNHRIYGYYLNGYKYFESELGTFGSFNLFYRYDGAGRLKRETEYGMADYNNVFTYDLRGNCISKSDNDNDIVTTYTYDAADRLLLANTSEDGTATEGHTYTYDYRGCLTEEDIDNYTDNTSVTKTYGYDYFGRLTSYSDGTTTAKYEYNADNLRTAKTVNNTRTDYVWDGANLMYEYGGTTGSYAYDMTGILQSGTDTYLKDEHGNVIGKYSSACVSLGAVQYDAFGSKLNTTINDPFGYCGEYCDSESGLIYLRNRYYDSSTGRFITEDPAKDGLNWYSYCAGNPVNAWDPWGLEMMISKVNIERGEVDTIISYLEKLSDIKLAYNQETNRIEIEKIYDTYKHVGQTLVLSLIRDEKNTIVLNYNIKVPGRSDFRFETSELSLMDNSLPAVYFQSECNERCDVKNKDEKISSETISPLIALGHELFHAYHYIMGSYYNDINMQASINHNEECNAVEEYITVGINFKSYDGHMVDRKFYDNIMCENGLRIEQAKATGNPLYLRVSLKSYSSEDL